MCKYVWQKKIELAETAVLYKLAIDVFYRFTFTGI
jgi:hypothetical protein